MGETQENWVTPEMAQATTTFKTFLLLAKDRRKMVGGGGGRRGVEWGVAARLWEITRKSRVNKVMVVMQI